MLAAKPAKPAKSLFGSHKPSHCVFVLQCTGAHVQLIADSYRFPQLYRPNDRTISTDDVNCWCMAEIKAMLFSYRGSVDVFLELGSSLSLRDARRINTRTAWHAFDPGGNQP
jgi:hypothetical protein